MSDTQPEIVKAYRISESGSLVVVIPKAIRRQIEVSQGTYFQVRNEDDELIYQPVNFGEEVDKNGR